MSTNTQFLLRISNQNLLRKKIKLVNDSLFLRLRKFDNNT